MTTLAAIWYTEDQNEPSTPFVLKLDIDRPKFKESTEAQLKKEYFLGLAGEDGDNTEHADDPATVDWFPKYGQVSVSTRDSSQHLIVGFSAEDSGLLAEARGAVVASKLVL
jgi:hypothetical protein